ncbi:superkiller complex protein 2 isoform X2 [Hydra vulgaris]|uniref:Superkiller complex protein 2 isoform X2 n=1 Tax=Hydra vulgaris TaxID=6087 RepID=A0ABM4BFS1_HYDVU
MDVQLRIAEEYKINSSLLLDELKFDFVEFGISGHVKAIANEEKILPHSTLPIGVPPLLPDLKYELETFLLAPLDLPIHAFQNHQRSWSREKNLDNMFDAVMLPHPTDICMERDPKTGKLKGYQEVLCHDVGLNAQNSMSMNRKPGPLTDSVKGESSNKPFWPGGVFFSEALLKTVTHPNSDEIFEVKKENYLTRPPGFSFDISFDNIERVSLADSSTNANTISINDIISNDIDLTSLYINIDDDEQVVEAQESPVDVALLVTDDISSQLLQVEDDFPSKRIKDEEKKWATLDDFTDVKDFHRLVVDMAFKFPFELDVFQKRAILHLEKHENILVAAHTSAGKTVVAEYAIALAQKHMRKAIYTSPIKALSNQKFRDFRDTFPEVGLLTGDVQIKPEATCLIMTTEILRSMLYNGSDVIRDVEWVIFDEIHYINDLERGVVYEEVLIMLPSHVGIILLSATVPNTLEFASWIGKTKQKEVYVVQTKMRPVPLEHYLYTGNSNKTSNELFCILDQKGNFLLSGYRAALNAKKERASKVDESYGPKGVRQGNPLADKSVWLSLLSMLQKKDQLPVVAFTLSKKKCDQNAEKVSSVELVTSTERSHIISFFNKSLRQLKGSDRQLPQVLWLEELLKNGIGVHHSGILPILKEIVEMLFSRGLLKILFATETFAMGVNMPARTVVFDSTRKFDGNNFRDLHSSEYIQMAGRAGRRGLDNTGMVILLCKGDVPETSDLNKMMLGTPTKLTSQFRLTYYMILNLLRVKQLTVQDMMKRSFSEYYLQKDGPENEKKLEELRIKCKQLKDLDCPVCSIDLKAYYLAWTECYQLQKQIKNILFSSMQCQKLLVPGRLLLVTNANHKHSLSVILQIGGLGNLSSFKGLSSKNPLEKLYTVLILCDKNYEEMKMSDISTTKFSKEEEVKHPNEMFLQNVLFIPKGQCGQIVEEIIAADICEIVNKVIKIDLEKILENHKKRLIPRFRSDPPSQSTVIAGQQLFNLAKDFNDKVCPVMHPIHDLCLNEIEFVEKHKKFERILPSLHCFNCLDCPDIIKHFSLMQSNMQVKEDVAMLEFRLSDENLNHMQEYHQRIEVLKTLNYIDKEMNLQHKGRVAFEISTHEVMITELLINNVLTDLHPSEIVAVLSCFVFEQKQSSPPTLTDNLQKVVNTVKQIAKTVAVCQKKQGLNVTVEEFIEELHFGLVEVVYEWARGMSFKDIMNLTDVSEGNIVRCIQRLDETCRDVRKAAHVIGVQALCDKMEEGMSLIRRDVVFAASLYTS